MAAALIEEEKFQAQTIANIFDSLIINSVAEKRYILKYIFRVKLIFLKIYSLGGNFFLYAQYIPDIIIINIIF